MGFQICQDETSDAVLDESAFALLSGMLLDQQYPMEHAFRGPAKIRARLGSFDVVEIADMDPEKFKSICSETPAIHRFPGSMAGRLQQLAQLIVEDYDGDASRIWTEAESGKHLLQRLQKLPGFGKQKAQIFTTLLAKQCDVAPLGWDEVVGDYALDGYRSVADVTGAESLQKVRDFKKEKKAAAKAAKIG